VKKKQKCRCKKKEKYRCKKSKNSGAKKNWCKKSSLRIGELISLVILCITSFSIKFQRILWPFQFLYSHGNNLTMGFILCARNAILRAAGGHLTNLADEKINYNFD